MTRYHTIVRLADGTIWQNILNRGTGTSQTNWNGFMGTDLVCTQVAPDPIRGEPLTYGTPDEYVAAGYHESRDSSLVDASGVRSDARLVQIVTPTASSPGVRSTHVTFTE